MPDEYLPPNKILFLQNLPETTTQKQLMELFSQYASYFLCAVPQTNTYLNRYPNLLEVRIVPTKKDIAFVEYTDEKSSSAAKDALHNYRLDEEHKIKVRVLDHHVRIDLVFLHLELRSPLLANKIFALGWPSRPNSSHALHYWHLCTIHIL